MASSALAALFPTGPHWADWIKQFAVVDDKPEPVYLIPPAWSPNAVDQAKSRVDRKSACDWTVVPKIKYLDPATLDQCMLQMIDIKKELDRMGKGMIADVASYRGGHGDYNFVQAFMEAMQSTPHYCAGEIVRPHFRDADLAAHWIFGPRCETVSFAKVKAIKDYENGELLYSARQAVQHGLNVTLDFSLRGVEFEARLLADPYRWPAPHSSYEFHIRFKTYKDMAAWADMASRDHTRVQTPLERF
ncbi:hypothetical protein CcrColossus_gp194 [Caulobacter phage CcrColossus]|uniref:Uncharacterized protein n=1 Tax=Caulobacter phage CcrColossus TaxID=1211640 RepID=K4JRV4_9CAUD|nr:hypothetical protein CcrColossus_gp194 [Caulobacter phage CcrColossus]AFU88064.1 hypothetical protein CcrColossus_gp194 [Caulobacter phage CcrColossus]